MQTFIKCYERKNCLICELKKGSSLFHMESLIVGIICGWIRKSFVSICLKATQFLCSTAFCERGWKERFNRVLLECCPVSSNSAPQKTSAMTYIRVNFHSLLIFRLLFQYKVQA